MTPPNTRNRDHVCEFRIVALCYYRDVRVHFPSQGSENLYCMYNSNTWTHVQPGVRRSLDLIG